MSVTFRSFIHEIARECNALAETSCTAVRADCGRSHARPDLRLAAKVPLAIVGLVSPANSIPTPRFRMMWQRETVREELEQWVLHLIPAVVRPVNTQFAPSPPQEKNRLLTSVYDGHSFGKSSFAFCQLRNQTVTFEIGVLGGRPH
jgi:hypothetical protein